MFVYTPTCSGVVNYVQYTNIIIIIYFYIAPTPEVGLSQMLSDKNNVAF